MFRVSVCRDALQLLLQYVVLDELEDRDAKAKLPKGIKTSTRLIEKILKDQDAVTQLMFNLGVIIGAVECAWKGIIKDALGKYGKFIPLPIKQIEEIGGGSARCMLCEIFLRK